MPLKETFFAFLLIGLTLLVAIQEAKALETYDGRPPDAFASTIETCTCTSSDGTFPYTCTVYRPPETRPCFEVCVELADMYSATASAAY